MNKFDFLYSIYCEQLKHCYNYYKASLIYEDTSNNSAYNSEEIKKLANDAEKGIDAFNEIVKRKEDFEKRKAMMKLIHQAIKKSREENKKNEKHDFLTDVGNAIGNIFSDIANTFSATFDKDTAKLLIAIGIFVSDYEKAISTGQIGALGEILKSISKWDKEKRETLLSVIPDEYEQYRELAKGLFIANNKSNDALFDLFIKSEDAIKQVLAAKEKLENIDQSKKTEGTIEALNVAKNNGIKNIRKLKFYLGPKYWHKLIELFPQDVQENFNVVNTFINNAETSEKLAGLTADVLQAKLKNNPKEIVDILIKYINDGLISDFAKLCMKLSLTITDKQIDSIVDHIENKNFKTLIKNLFYINNESNDSYLFRRLIDLEDAVKTAANAIKKFNKLQEENKPAEAYDIITLETLKLLKSNTIDIINDIQLKLQYNNTWDLLLILLPNEIQENIKLIFKFIKNKKNINTITNILTVLNKNKDNIINAIKEMLKSGTLTTFAEYCQEINKDESINLNTVFNQIGNETISNILIDIFKKDKESNGKIFNLLKDFDALINRAINIIDNWTKDSINDKNNLQFLKDVYDKYNELLNLFAERNEQLWNDFIKLFNEDIQTKIKTITEFIENPKVKKALDTVFKSIDDIKNADNNTLVEIIIQAFKKGLISDIANIAKELNKDWDGKSKIEVLELLPENYSKQKQLIYDILRKDKKSNNNILNSLCNLDVHIQKALKIVDQFKLHNNKDLINEDKLDDIVDVLNEINKDDLKDLFDPETGVLSQIQNIKESLGETWNDLLSYMPKNVTNNINKITSFNKQNKKSISNIITLVDNNNDILSLLEKGAVGKFVDLCESFESNNLVSLNDLADAIPDEKNKNIVKKLININKTNKNKLFDILKNIDTELTTFIPSIKIYTKIFNTENEDINNEIDFNKLLKDNTIEFYTTNLEVLPQLQNSKILTNIHELKTLLSKDPKLYDEFLNLISADNTNKQNDEKSFFTKENINLLLSFKNPPSQSLIDSIIKILKHINEMLKSSKVNGNTLFEDFINNDASFESVVNFINELSTYLSDNLSTTELKKLISWIPFSQDKEKNQTYLNFTNIIVEAYIRNKSNFFNTIKKQSEILRKVYKEILTNKENIHACENENNLTGKIFFKYFVETYYYIKLSTAGLKSIKEIYNLFNEEELNKFKSILKHEFLNSDIFTSIKNKLQNTITKVKEKHQNIYNFCYTILKNTIDLSTNTLTNIREFLNKNTETLYTNIYKAYNYIKEKNINIDKIIEFLNKSASELKNNISNFFNNFTKTWENAAKVYAKNIEKKNNNITGKKGKLAQAAEFNRSYQNLQPWNN